VTRTYSYADLSFFCFFLHIILFNIKLCMDIECCILYPYIFFGSIFHTHFCVFFNGGVQEHHNVKCSHYYYYQFWRKLVFGPYLYHTTYLFFYWREVENVISYTYLLRYPWHGSFLFHSRTGSHYPACKGCTFGEIQSYIDQYVTL
jgi:hypothetical protein